MNFVRARSLSLAGLHYNHLCHHNHRHHHYPYHWHYQYHVYHCCFDLLILNLILTFIIIILTVLTIVISTNNASLIDISTLTAIMALP